MKFIRFILNGLVLVIVLVAVLAAAAFVPIVQTWVGQMVLADQPRLHGSLGALSAGLREVDFTDLHLDVDGADLTLPSLQVQLPLATAAWDRKIEIRSLVAKGWTLDLTAKPQNGPTPAASEPESGGATEPAQVEADSAQAADRAFRKILGKWNPARDFSLDGVDLEGDVLVAAPSGKAPVRVHVIVSGGRGGAFTFDASGVVVASNLQAYDAAAHGRLGIAIGSRWTLNRLGIKADLAIKGGTFPEPLAFSVAAAEVWNPGDKSCVMSLRTGNRQLASVLADFSEATRRWAGRWEIKFKNTELAPFMPDRPLPSLAIDGSGRFDADAAFTQVHAVGGLNATASNLGVLAPVFDHLGEMRMFSRFDLTQRGPSARFDLLTIDLSESHPVVRLRALQPFDFNEETGDIKTADPRGDWMDISIRGLPLAWLSGLTDQLAWAGGDATGEFVARAADGGFALRPKAPLISKDVSLRHGGTLLGHGLDLSLSLLADCTAQGWEVRGSPLAIDGAGRRLATVEAKASRPAGADQPIAIAGTWSADLDALAARSTTSGIRWIAGRSASGDFSASLGTATQWDGKVAVIGHDPDHSVTASVHAGVDAYGVVEFSAPVRIAFWSSASEVSLDGTWTSDKAGPVIDAKLSGKTVALEHLRWLAAPFSLAGAGRDGAPFWGGWTGGLGIAFDHLMDGKREFKDVSGTFYVDRGSLRLEDGECELPHRRSAKMDGAITFDAAAQAPYRLKAVGSVAEVDAASLFGPAKPGKEPMLEGRFSLATTITGDGINLDDLASRTQEEFRLAGTNGIIRLLKTSVAESLPEAPSKPVSDALDSARSAVDTVFGFKQKSDPNEIRLGKNTEAVLNFSYQVAEIGYDRMTVTAIRGADRAIRVVDMAVTAPDERLTGSGQIAYAEGLPLRARPLTLKLQLGVHGSPAELLSTAGLLSPGTDKSGYATLDQPIIFRGTLEHIDDTQWRALLAKAAMRKPPAPSK